MYLIFYSRQEGRCFVFEVEDTGANRRFWHFSRGFDLEQGEYTYYLVDSAERPSNVQYVGGGLKMDNAHTILATGVARVGVYGMSVKEYEEDNNRVIYEE